jgi:hypothetical protein
MLADKMAALRGRPTLISFLLRHGSAILPALFLAATMLQSCPAAAEGALAVGLPKDVAKDGFAYGYSTGKADTKTARDAALDLCRKPADNRSVQARALCAVVGTFNNQCVAVAMDPGTGTPGVGWAIAGDLASAQAGAIAQCKATAGALRREFCTVDHSHCEGTAK